MIRTGMIKRVIVICGSAETSLRDQARADVISMRDEYQMALIKKGDGDGQMKILKGQIDVCFSNELKNVKDVTDHTLVIHEECHMAQSKGNKPYKEFYKKNHLEGALLGDFRSLRENSNFILGVSATPFSEIVSNHKDETFSQVDFEPEEKLIFPMTPGAGYLGVSKFYRNGQGSIKFTAKPVDDPASHFFQVLEENSEKYQGKYCIVRTFESKETHDIISMGCERLGYDCLHSFAGEEGIKAILSKKPVKLTVIHISGRCRMGQVLDKEHLGMVYESSKSPNADTLLQGLVGRVCGYDSNLNIDVYVSKPSEEHIKTYSEAWLEDGTVNVDCLGKINKAMNLSGRTVKSLKAKSKSDEPLPGGRNKGPLIMPIHPICIPSDVLDLNSTEAERVDVSVWIHQCLEENPDLMKNKVDRDEIMRKLLDCGRDPSKKVRKSLRTNHEQDEERLSKAVRENERFRPGWLKSVEDCPGKFTPEDQSFILYKRQGSTDYYLGGWVLYRKDVHEEDDEKLPKPKVSPACNFVPSDESVEDDLPLSSRPKKDQSSGSGGNSAGSSSGNSSMQSSSETTNSVCEIIELVSLPKRGCYVDTVDEFTKTVQTLVKMGITSYKHPDDAEPLPVFMKKSVFSKEEIIKIKKQMKTELGIKITIKGYPGRPSGSDDYRKMQTITW